MFIALVGHPQPVRGSHYSSVGGFIDYFIDSMIVHPQSVRDFVKAL